MLAELLILGLTYHPPQNITCIMSLLFTTTPRSVLDLGNGIAEMNWGCKRARASGWAIWKTNKLGAKEM